MTKVSAWLVVPDAEYCCMRIVEGGDPNNIADRVAFIEKTPRVRFEAFVDIDNDWKKWRQGDKGCGGAWNSDHEALGQYGYDPESRAWCDEELKKMGYELE